MESVFTFNLYVNDILLFTEVFLNNINYFVIYVKNINGKDNREDFYSVNEVSFIQNSYIYINSVTDFYVHYEACSDDVFIFSSDIVKVIVNLDVQLLNGVTLTDCINSLINTDVLSCVIPGNTIDEGDLITVDILSKILNNSGGSVSIQRIIGVGSNYTGSYSNSLSSSSVLAYWFCRSYLFRVGSDLWISQVITGLTTTGYTLGSPLSFGMFSPGMVPFTGSNGLIISAPDFTNNLTFKEQIKFSVANTNIYYKPQSSWVYKYKKSGV